MPDVPLTGRGYVPNGVESEVETVSEDVEFVDDGLSRQDTPIGADRQEERLTLCMVSLTGFTVTVVPLLEP